MMIKRNSNLREKYLDGEKLFRKYYEMGDSRTITLLTEWAITEGMTSSKGTQPTEMGVWKAMWRWASLKENRETAWEISKDATYGSTKNPFKFTKGMWVKDMIKVKIPSAWQHATVAKKEKFMRENGWAE